MNNKHSQIITINFNINENLTSKDLALIEQIKTIKQILQSNLKKSIKKLVAKGIIQPRKYIYLSVSINDSQTNQELNAKYRNKNKIADILSFPMPPIPNLEINNLGDLAFDYHNIVSYSKSLDIDAKKRFIQLAVHGLLHLCQFNHDDEIQFLKMKKIEDYILSFLNTPKIEEE